MMRDVGCGVGLSEGVCNLSDEGGDAFINITWRERGAPM